MLFFYIFVSKNRPACLDGLLLAVFTIGIIYIIRYRNEERFSEICYEAFRH